MIDLFKEEDIFTHIFVVNENIYNDFQKCSNDLNPLHTNKKFAIRKGFLDKVMYGNILNAFLSYFVGELLPTKEVIIHSQKIDFKKPVYLNDKLLFEAKVSGVYESVNAIEFKYKFFKSDRQIAAKGLIQIGVI